VEIPSEERGTGGPPVEEEKNRRRTLAGRQLHGDRQIVEIPSEERGTGGPPVEEEKNRRRTLAGRQCPSGGRRAEALAPWCIFRYRFMAGPSGKSRSAMFENRT